MPKYRVSYHGPDDLVFTAESDVLAEIAFLNYLEEVFPFFAEKIEESQEGDESAD